MLEFIFYNSDRRVLSFNLIFDIGLAILKLIENFAIYKGAIININTVFGVFYCLSEFSHWLRVLP